MAMHTGKDGGVSFADNLEPGVPEADRLESDPRWQLVTRIVSSPGFSKSPRLVSFLLFVTRRSLADPSSQINEQSIGVTVFGRSSGYDSNDDNIVRSHASRLRLKLEAYFQNDGADEPLQVSIPKGSYIPLFYETAREASAPVSGAAEPPLEPVGHVDHVAEAIQDRRETQPPLSVPPQTFPGRASGSRYWLLILAACVLSSAVTYWVAAGSHHRASSGAPEANHALWQELLNGRQNTLVVSGDSSLVLYENMTGKLLSIAEYVSGNYRDELETQTKTDPHMLRTIARRRLTSIVDLDIANRITSRVEFTPVHDTLRYARDLHVDDLKGANVILIGSQEANPWVQLYADSLNFTMVPDQQTKVFAIHNRKPKPGEAAEYQSIPGDPDRRAYAVIALLNNLDGTGHTLIMQGTGMAGTEAAADYVLGQSELSSLLHADGRSSASLPNFEILLETYNLNGNASKSKLVALRIDGK